MIAVIYSYLHNDEVCYNEIEMYITKLVLYLFFYSNLWLVLVSIFSQ